MQIQTATPTPPGDSCFVLDRRDAQTRDALYAEIRALKEERDAVILAHNYMETDLFAVADVLGDSLDLALKAEKVERSVIVFCGVHFMAETAKIVNPSRTVLLPDLGAGCSLADAADADDVVDRVDALRESYGDDLAVVSYVNTTAAVKAVSDVCCTSANAPDIVRALPQNNILFLPDRNLASWVQTQVPDKKVIAWEGNCYVHEQITPEEITRMREAVPGIVVFVHPECRADVRALADEVMSTSQMARAAHEREDKEFLVVTECGLSGRLELEAPSKRFYKACKLCMFMKRISLENLRDALRDGQHEVIVPDEIAVKARRALTRMFEITAAARSAQA